MMDYLIKKLLNYFDLDEIVSVTTYCGDAPNLMPPTYRQRRATVAGVSVVVIFRKDDGSAETLAEIVENNNGDAFLVENEGGGNQRK